MLHYNLYFQCVVRLYLKDDFRFDQLRILYDTDTPYVDVSSTVPIRANAIRFQAFHAFARFESLEAKRVLLQLHDGFLKFELDGQPQSYDLQGGHSVDINSRLAVVTVESSLPLRLAMTDEVARRALLRAAAVSVAEGGGTHTTAALHSSEHAGFSLSRQSVSVRVIGGEAPLYVTARPRGADTATVRQQAGWAAAAAH